MKSSSSYEILSHREVGFRGFIKYIFLMFIADLNPLKGSRYIIRGGRIDILIVHRPFLNKIKFSLGLDNIVRNFAPHNYPTFSSPTLREGFIKRTKNFS